MHKEISNICRGPLTLSEVIGEITNQRITCGTEAYNMIKFKIISFHSISYDEYSDEKKTISQ